MNIAESKQPQEIIVDGMETDASIKFNAINIDEIIDDEQYVHTISSLLQSILNSRFPGNAGKQKIIIHKDRINFACPICGDSMQSNYKKRGNFILKGKYKGFFKCHNCGSSSRIDTFFRDHKITLDLSVINYIANNIESFSTHIDSKYDISLFLDMNYIDKYAIDRKTFLEYFKLIEAKESSIWPWLTARLQYDSQKFMYNPRLNHIIILNLTQSGKILGAQKRTFKGHNKYLTYKLSKIYELMKKNPKEVPDEIDTISQLFNICLVNYSKPISLFEGAFDAFLYKNSIANTGANKNFPLDIQVRYFYDDDITGRDKSIEKINKGEEIFLWGKLKHDLELPYRKKWDMNDLMIYLKQNKINAPIFEDYFSNDALDIIDI